MFQKLNPKGVLSAGLAMAVSSFFWFGSLSSYASNTPIANNTPADGLSGLQAGVLSGTGTLSLNGISTEPGVTVFSGSIIATGQDGIASIDLGPVGRCVVRPRTTVTMTLSPGTAMVTARARANHVSVMRGELLVTSPGANRVLKSGQEAVFADSVEATMIGDTVFTIEDQAQKDQSQKDAGSQQDPNNPGQNPSPTPSPSPSPKKKTTAVVPWWGWVGMAGVAGGIAAGLATHGEEQPSARRVSSPQP